MKVKRYFIRLILVFSFSFLYAEGFLHERLEKRGLLNVQILESTIQVELKYASKDNFLGRDVYGDLKACYLQAQPAKMLARAQKILQKTKPQFSLRLYDCLRPRQVQYKMWDVVKGTPLEGYVANPIRGSIHNYGAAVDLTVVDSRGIPLDMGTPFDFFGDLAQPRHEGFFLRKGKLSRTQLDNRLLLRRVMQEVGFLMIQNEWWHFNAFSLGEVKKKYQIVE